MKGKKWDLLAQKGLKWVSDRIHALVKGTGDFCQVSQRTEVGSKLQAKLESHCFANPPNRWNGREQRQKAPNHGAAVESPRGAHEHSMIHQKASRPQAGSGWHYMLQPLLHKTL